MNIKHLLLLFLVLFCATYINIIAESENSIVNFENLFYSIVKIETNKTQKDIIDPDGLVPKKVSYGTGFYVTDYGLILTAAHVVDEESKILNKSIRCTNLATMSSFLSTVVKIDRKKDIALLIDHSTFNKHEHYINLSSLPNINIKENSICYCIGIPNDYQKTDRLLLISLGNIISSSFNLSGHRKIEWRKNVILTSCQVSAGFSGGIVTTDDFIPSGIILGTFEKDEKFYSFARKIKDAQYLIKEYEEDNF